MARRVKASNVLLGLCALAVAFVVCFFFVHARLVEQQEQVDEVIIQEAVQQQEARHQAVEEKRAALPPDYGLDVDYSFQQSLVRWDTPEIRNAGENAERFLAWERPLSPQEKADLEGFALRSPEIENLLQAIDGGLCEVEVDPTRGLPHVLVSQIGTMVNMLAARASLQAERGETEAALDSLLRGYQLVESISVVPDISLLSSRASFLVPLTKVVWEEFFPPEALEKFLKEREKCLQNIRSPEPVVAALRLHESLVRREVAEREVAFLQPFFLAGYHEGIETIIEELYVPRPNRGGTWFIELSDRILAEVPNYSLQTRWRLQDVMDVLYAQADLNDYQQETKSLLGRRISFTPPNTEDKNLPMVLLVCSDAARDNGAGVADALAGIANAGQLIIVGPTFGRGLMVQLRLLFRRSTFDLIHISSSLHGYNWPENEFAGGLARTTIFLKEWAPETDVIWSTLPPVSVLGVDTSFLELQGIVVPRNAIAKEVMAQHDIAVNDLYPLMDGHPEYYAEDGIHLNSDGQAVQAAQIAKVIEEKLAERARLAQSEQSEQEIQNHKNEDGAEAPAAEFPGAEAGQSATQ